MDIGPGSDKVHSKHECTVVKETGTQVRRQEGVDLPLWRSQRRELEWQTGWLHHCHVMAVTPNCGFPLWWDLQRGSRAVDGWWWWDWKASYACRAGRRFREGGEEQARLAPIWNTSGHGRERIMDTKPRCPSGFLQQKARLIGRL